MFYEDPSFGNFMAGLTDFVSYYIMPLHGGWQRIESHIKFGQDQRAYGDAGVTEDYLFKQSNNMFKETFWMCFGVFSRLTESAFATVNQAIDAGNTIADFKPENLDFSDIDIGS